MIKNREYYLDKIESVDPRPEAVAYFERQAYEEKLMGFIEESFTFNDYEPLIPTDENLASYFKTQLITYSYCKSLFYFSGTRTKI